RGLGQLGRRRFGGGLGQRLQHLGGVGGRGIRGGVGDRCALGGLPRRVGDLRRLLKRRLLSRRRRLARIAIHRTGILSPILPVLGLQLRNQRRVLPQHIRRLQLIDLHPIRRHQRRRHRRRQRRLIGRRRRTRLHGRLLGLRRRRPHPRDVGKHRLSHRHRRRPQPLLTAQRGDHLLITERRRIQLRRQRTPRRRRRHQRTRPR